MHRPSFIAPRALSVILCALAFAGCSARDTGDMNDQAGSENGAENGSENGSENGAENGSENGSESGMEVDCDMATSEAACDAAVNLAEGQGCTWMQIYDLTVDAGGACNFEDTGEGLCVGTSGLDDGCNAPGTCGEAYHRSTGPDTWQMAWGQACRGVPDFEQCLDEVDVPCSCACEMP